MTRKYTAQEMREKKYEYAIKWCDGKVSALSRNKEDVLEAVSDINSDGLIICHSVRREVGEWEEVSNG